MAGVTFAPRLSRIACICCTTVEKGGQINIDLSKRNDEKNTLCARLFRCVCPCVHKQKEEPQKKTEYVHAKVCQTIGKEKAQALFAQMGFNAHQAILERRQLLQLQEKMIRTLAENAYILWKQASSSDATESG